MLEARIMMGAPSGALLPRLQSVADLLVSVNVTWMREQFAAGRVPPCCTLCAAPPWTRGGALAYVEHHGAPVGTSRVYLDAPTLLEHGQGTCIDLAAYDAAAMQLQGTPARARVIQTGRHTYHCVCEAWGNTIDSAARLAAAKER